MKNERLPPELERLERSFGRRPRFEPSDALRQRVLYGVHAELGRQPPCKVAVCRRGCRRRFRLDRCLAAGHALDQFGLDRTNRLRR